MSLVDYRSESDDDELPPAPSSSSTARPDHAPPKSTGAGAASARSGLLLGESNPLAKSIFLPSPKNAEEKDDTTPLAPTSSLASKLAALPPTKSTLAHAKPLYEEDEEEEEEVEEEGEDEDSLQSSRQQEAVFPLPKPPSSSISCLLGSLPPPRSATGGGAPRLNAKQAALLEKRKKLFSLPTFDDAVCMILLHTHTHTHTHTHAHACLLAHYTS